ncbi:ethanolamine ammonia-lyase reactivating factor EutA [Desulfitobacterium hafniense]|uniref:ethanolamine ammonia-lyase reactivating factor EutA n=1 Tax=Desulfitobacterium hafniense TaxID=49338 RepID=UPI00035C644E
MLMSRSDSQIITSVGIDIGTTTTQLVLSRLTIENTASVTLVPRVSITAKEVIHRSRIHLTPLLEHHLINGEEISRLVEEEYRLAAMTPRDIDSGAVIITGETAKKENAKALLDVLAGFAGDFVVAAAGPNLESIYAGKGSGAAAYSAEKHQEIVNIDVGGGTSNFAVFREGQAIDTTCLNIGGRLLEIEPGGDRVTYIAQPMQAVLRAMGRWIRVGEVIQLEHLREIAALMAQSIVEVILSKNLSSLTGELLMAPPLSLNYPLNSIMVSGGVADYVYKDSPPCSMEEVSAFGDMGPLLGWMLSEKIIAAGFALIKPLETVRATVIGTGTQSISLSGSTIHVQGQTSLPLRNILVAKPFPEGSAGIPAAAEEIGDFVRKSVSLLYTEGQTQHLALAFQGPRTLSFLDIQTLAKGIVLGVDEFIAGDKPLILIIEKDCGKILGQCLTALCGKHRELICIDQLCLENCDYIDIGKPLMEGRVIPVVMKTLVFDTKKL